MALKYHQSRYTAQEIEEAIGNGLKYTPLSVATNEKLGGVKPAAKTTTMTQAVGVDEKGRLFTAPTEHIGAIGIDATLAIGGYEADAMAVGERFNGMAGALKVETERATTHSINADANSPLCATIYGATTQVGEGTPAPANIRAVSGVSDVTITTEDAKGNSRSASLVMQEALFNGDTAETYVLSGCDLKLVLTGAEDWVDYQSMYFTVNGLPHKAGKPYTGFCTHWPYKYDYAANDLFVGDNVLYCGTALRSKFDGDVELFKAYLVAQYEAGTPVTLWYRTEDYTDEKQLRIARSTHARYCVVLTGQEGWWKSHDYYALNGFPKAATTYSGACSHFEYKWNYDYYGVFVGGDVLYCGKQLTAAYADVSAWKAFLMEQYSIGTPVTLVYETATTRVFGHEPAAVYALGANPEAVTTVGESVVEYNADLKTYIDTKIAEIAGSV